MMRLFRLLPLAFRLRLLAMYTHRAFTESEQDLIIEVLGCLAPGDASSTGRGSKEGGSDARSS
jgi:hypothetical protein